MLSQRTKRPVFLLFGALIAGFTVAAAVHFGAGFTASVFDGEGLIGGLEKAEEELQGTGIREETDIVKPIADIIRFILMFIAIAAVIVIIAAGIILIFSFGSDGAIQRARKMIIWAIVGLIVVLLAFVIVEFVIDIITAGSSPGPGPGPTT